MKYLLFYIVFIFSVFKTASAEVNTSLPEDFKGVRTREFMELRAQDIYPDRNAVNTAYMMLEVGKYFNDKYPENDIFEKDLTSELQPFFPDDTWDELKAHEGTLKSYIRLYRIGLHIYNSYITEKLTPHTYKQVHSDEDFDHPGEVTYIPAKEGKFIKVYNFKKFLTYSNNEDELAAIADYKRLAQKDLTVLDKIDYIFRKIEWKKILLYGEKYENPLLSKLGISEFQQGAKTKARLLSDSTYIDGQKKLRAGLQIITQENSFILANNLSPSLLKPQIILDDSENMESYKVLYPVPLNTVSLTMAHKYFGDFLIPVEVTVKDPSKPLKLKGHTIFQACNSTLECTEEKYDIALTLEPFGLDFFFNGYSNYFNQAYASLPQDNAQSFKLKKFVIDDNAEEGQSLRLEFSATEKIDSFKIFIEDTNGYTRFSGPLTSIQDNTIYVRFKPLDKTAKLADTEFTITAVFNTTDSLRTTQKPTTASLFDPNVPSLNFALIFFAFLGGLILNFMPCVFPALSLKIISLSQANNMKSKHLKRSLLMTVYGIFSGFTILTILLLIAKYLGYSLGWGMQFQNMGFLVVMTFILTSFTIILPKINFNNLYKKTIAVPHSKTNFLIGNLIVLLSTPCTGPYLATAVGFALTGSYLDIIVIMYAVALGLSAPYLLAYSLKEPQTLMPQPGPWLIKLQIFMQIMLYLTIIWFLSLILGQTDWICILKIIFAIFIFTALFKLYREVQDRLDGVFDESVTLQTIEKIRRNSRIAVILCFSLLFYWSYTQTQQSYLSNLEQNLIRKQTLIDNNLIAQKLNDGHAVLLEIGADWCMTCHFNNALALSESNLQYWQANYNLELLKVDWTNYNQEVLAFMEKYGRKGLPFYILYTPIIRDGIVLPEIFSGEELTNILNGSYKR